MIKTKSAASKYTLRKQGVFYVISYKNKDVFYYNIKTLLNYYPYKMSVDHNYFDDKYMNYIMNKLMWHNISEAKEKKYLILFFKRLSSYDAFHNFKLNPMSLDKNGKFNINAHNYYTKNYYKISNNPLQYVTADKPYFEGQSNLIFNYLEREIDDYVLEVECKKVVRSQFEEQLSNIELGLAYVEFYSDENEFCYAKIIENSDFFGHFTFCYYLFKNNKLELCFFKK